MPASDAYDVIVIGAGADGMTAAAVAAAEGLRVLVIEKTEFVGGTTAWSGGMVWIPANSKMKQAGIEDCRMRLAISPAPFPKPKTPTCGKPFWRAVRKRSSIWTRTRKSGFSP
jgi:glycine/D-amino acid oxidase-like deaminating enzyme